MDRDEFSEGEKVAMGHQDQHQKVDEDMSPTTQKQLLERIVGLRLLLDHQDHDEDHQEGEGTPETRHQLELDRDLFRELGGDLSPLRQIGEGLREIEDLKKQIEAAGRLMGGGDAWDLFRELFLLCGLCCKLSPETIFYFGTEFARFIFAVVDTRRAARR